MRPLSRRIAGWIGADGNPLRRRMDRFESAVRIALVLVFAVGAVLLVPVAGHLTVTAGMRQVRQERSWQQVRATLLRPAPPQFYGYGSMATSWVRGRWHAPSGALRSGLVPTRTGASAGSVVGIWVNRAGWLTGHRPTTAAMVRIRSVLVEFVTVACLGLVLLMVAGLVRWLLNRRRMTYWAIQWACFGPRWTARRWPRS